MTLRSLLSLAVSVSAAWGQVVPSTPKSPVNDTYHGVVVTDDYRWLEDWGDPKVKAWSESQNAYARSILDKLPSTDEIRARLTTLLSGASTSYRSLKSRGDVLFALEFDPTRQQPCLVVMPGPDRPDQRRAIVDPNLIDPTGLTAIDWFEPSPDGGLVAVSMSEGGSESGTVHVFRADNGERTGDVIPRAHGGTAGGSLAWAADSRSFYYTRYPRAGERPESEMDFFVQVYRHALGRPTSEDVYETGKEFPRIAEIVLEVVNNGGYVLASVQNGDGGEFMHWLKSETTGEWKQLTRWEDKVVQMVFGGDGFIYMTSRLDAPRGKVLRFSVKNPVLADAALIVPQIEYSIETDFFANSGVRPVGDKLFVTYQAGGPNELRVFGLTGTSLATVETPPICSIGEITPIGSDILINVETFLTPPAWFRYHDGQLERTSLAQTSPADTSTLEVVREFAISRDGTRVPMSIIRNKRLGMVLDNGVRPNDRTKPGSVKAKEENWELPAPTLVWGYGGYGVSESPSFSPRRMLFCEQGGVFVVTNLRGGGEYGEEWHRAGNLLNKQRVFDDFHACVRHVIDAGYTTKDRLAIIGGSNGGLLMGATFTQHPDLCRAVVSSVGIYDMLRVELSPNGAFNITEFGTVTDPAQFSALHAYSPYHRVRDGAIYPNILFMTGANDPRVDPMQSRKMTARLHAASPGSLTLLRTSANSGHGVGSSLAQRIEEYTDVYAFLFSQLGVRYKAPRDSSR